MADGTQFRLAAEACTMGNGTRGSPSGPSDESNAASDCVLGTTKTGPSGHVCPGHVVAVVQCRWLALNALNFDTESAIFELTDGLGAPSGPTLAEPCIINWVNTAVGHLLPNGDTVKLKSHTEPSKGPMLEPGDTIFHNRRSSAQAIRQRYTERRTG